MFCCVWSDGSFFPQFNAFFLAETPNVAILFVARGVASLLCFKFKKCVYVFSKKASFPCRGVKLHHTIFAHFHHLNHSVAFIDSHPYFSKTHVCTRARLATDSQLHSVSIHFYGTCSAQAVKKSVASKAEQRMVPAPQQQN
jgi:hypothetical protein